MERTGTYTNPKHSIGKLNIINLSSHILTEAEEQVLSLGLSFCPNRSLDNFETVKDIFLFARKLLLKSLYKKTTKQQDGRRQLLPTLQQQISRPFGTWICSYRKVRDCVWEDALESEASEDEEASDSQQKRQFKRKSHRFPPLSQNPALALVSCTVFQCEPSFRHL